ncbi:hypothetical protein J6590_101964 [Homalodisca vitripennis]|nr:hypothetical protein J6590_101964 [Homalodisca vitripennis]
MLSTCLEEGSNWGGQARRPPRSPKFGLKLRRQSKKGQDLLETRTSHKWKAQKPPDSIIIHKPIPFRDSNLQETYVLPETLHHQRADFIQAGGSNIPGAVIRKHFIMLAKSGSSERLNTFRG